MEDNTGTDTRTETTDKPTSQDRPYTPPPDNPGSPGQPSRRESIARARQDQMENGSSPTSQSSEISPKPAQERDDKPASPQTGNPSEKTDASGTPEAEDKEHDRDDGRPRDGQGSRRDGREPEPRSQDDRTSADGKTDTGTPGDRDRPQTASPEKGTDTRTETADKPATAERQWTPPPDNPGSPGQPSRRESIARAREDQLENASQQTEGTDTSSEPPQEHNDQPTSAQPENDGANTPAAGKADATDSDHGANRPETDRDGPQSGEATRQAETGAQIHPRDAGTPASSTISTDAPGEPAVGELEPRERPAEPPPDSEQNPQTADGSSNDGHRTQPESAEQPATAATDNAPSSPEEADRDAGTREPRGEQDRDRDKKSEDTDNEPSPNETNETDQEVETNPILVDLRSDSQGRVSFEPRYQRSDAPGTELIPEEQNTAGRESLPTRRDLDPVDPDRLRDDTGAPLETPEEQDLNESGRDRWNRMDRVKAGYDAARKVAGSAKDFLNQPPPTGQAETKSSSDMKPVHHQPTNPADLVSNGVILGVVVIGGARQMYTKIKNSRRS
ncbi:hypothetical protein [Spirillospora sp. NPDC048819]|uniref:hypothetical protein n=1 Tax=Spirillospora sp. NPDC048819 TaxID=3155268 RepID=UPI0033FBE1B9